MTCSCSYHSRYSQSRMADHGSQMIQAATTVPDLTAEGLKKFQKIEKDIIRSDEKMSKIESILLAFKILFSGFNGSPASIQVQTPDYVLRTKKITFAREYIKNHPTHSEAEIRAAVNKFSAEIVR